MSTFPQRANYFHPKCPLNYARTTLSCNCACDESMENTLFLGEFPSILLSLKPLTKEWIKNLRKKSNHTCQFNHIHETVHIISVRYRHTVTSFHFFLDLNLSVSIPMSFRYIPGHSFPLLCFSNTSQRNISTSAFNFFFFFCKDSYLTSFHFFLDLNLSVSIPMSFRYIPGHSFPLLCFSNTSQRKISTSELIFFL